MGKKVYLCGAMEFASDGKSWRDDVVTLLSPSGFSVWNPYIEEQHVGIPGALDFDNLDKEGNFEDIRVLMRKIIVYDLDTISQDVCALLVRLDRAVFSGAGTISEMSFAAYNNIPVHVWLDNLSLSDIPVWLLGTIDSYSFSLEEAVDNLIEWEQE